MIVAEIGAGGGPSQRWASVCPDYHAILVDPDPRAGGLESGPNRTIIRSLLLDRSGEADFHLYRAQPLSSVYPPNTTLLESLLRPEQVDAFRIQETRVLPCDTLDHQLTESGIGDADMLKIDVEGAELKVLLGASSVVRSAVGVEIEFAFLPVREGQPRFGAIDELLTSAGYELFDIEKSYFLRKGTGEYGRIKGQAIFGIGLYFVPPERLVQRKAISPEKLLAACYAYMAYGYYDIAETLLRLMHDEGLRLEEEVWIRSALRQRQRGFYIPRFTGREKLHRILARLTRALGPEGKNLVDPGVGNRW
ncbi:MAG: FkbM family methyltransferase [Ignavibacteria bacterium]|nr:FkbM family methyltransferase [Ignavibacteria bacterium]